MISVSLVAADTYLVAVESAAGGTVGGSVETEHRVHMSQTYYQQLCGAKVTHEWVLIQTFKFLLEREPNTSILSEFKLQQVMDYYPEFEAIISARLNEGKR